MTIDHLRQIASVPIDADEPRYREPLERGCRTLVELAGDDCDFVLLGSVATVKYLAPMVGVFGDRLLFPEEFIGRGDMSRGGLMLRCARAGAGVDLRPAGPDDAAWHASAEAAQAPLSYAEVVRAFPIRAATSARSSPSELDPFCRMRSTEELSRVRSSLVRSFAVKTITGTEAAPRQLAKLVDEREAVHLRHHQVEQDQPGRLRGRHLQRDAAVRRRLGPSSRPSPACDFRISQRERRRPPPPGRSLPSRAALYFRSTPTSRSRLIGLVMYSAAPSAKPMLLLSTIVSMMTGMSASAGSAFSAESTLQPSIFGIAMSSVITSGRASLAQPEPVLAVARQRDPIAFLASIARTGPGHRVVVDHQHRRAAPVADSPTARRVAVRPEPAPAASGRSTLVGSRMRERRALAVARLRR